MRTNPVTAWFRPKTFGVGWSPATWEGWCVTAAIVVAIFAISRVSG